ncbi:hypothetical protein M9H77_09001 [Catharanthus roseus]|uniref:Uncharacterized protein n=1 Tax=Catharanthus roseus TaxID=4058 RepID=A0ACC0BZK1_CATRO|nr:hypothetical protein M9H77_09001 [Catharanthus roseus]
MSVKGVDVSEFIKEVHRELNCNIARHTCIEGGEAYKWKQLSAVSGLNRGLVANEDVAKDLESVTGPVDLSADLLILEKILQYRTAFSVLLDAIRL